MKKKKTVDRRFSTTPVKQKLTFSLDAKLVKAVRSLPMKQRSKAINRALWSTVEQFAPAYATRWFSKKTKKTA